MSEFTDEQIESLLTRFHEAYEVAHERSGGIVGEGLRAAIRAVAELAAQWEREDLEYQIRDQQKTISELSAASIVDGERITALETELAEARRDGERLQLHAKYHPCGGADCDCIYAEDDAAIQVSRGDG